jgi:hypothetical protein
VENLAEFNTETINLDRRHDDFSIMVNIINDNSLISIQGNRMLEFRGLIRRIIREEQIEAIIEDEDFPHYLYIEDYIQ